MAGRGSILPRSGRLAGRLRESYRRSLALTVDPTYSASTIYLLVSLLMPALLLLIAQDCAQRRYLSAGALAVQELHLLLVLLVTRNGHAVLAGRLFCLGTWATVSWFLLAADAGARSAALLGYPAVLMIAGLLLDLRFFLATAGLVFAVVILASATGRSGAPERLFDILVILGFTAAAVVLYARDIRRALKRSKEQEARLAASTGELQRQADALKGTAQKLQTAMELAVEGVAHADAEGRITEANSRATEITGYARSELIGRQFTDLFSADELTRNPIRWALLDRGQAVTTERVLIRKDGTSIVVEMTSQRLPDRTLQCFVRDITGRRAQEDSARQRQRLESLGSLAGGVAHDFNNLLTVMHGALDSIAARGAAPEAFAGPLQDLRTVAERGNELTRQLLAFARKQALDRRQIDLRTTLEQNARLLRRVLGPEIELEIEPAGAPCPVFADAGALSQVVTNLAVNARDAMPRGGRLRLGCGAVVIKEPPRGGGGREISGGDFVCMHVADNGCGMSEEVRRRLFEPFFTTKGGDKGTGLGLSVSLGIVEQHGGWIEVSSEVGQGTEFRVFLPRQELVAPAEKVVAPMPVPATHGTEMILLVEDEEPVRRLAMGALEWCGFKVVEAADGVEALRLWVEKREHIRLLLTDVAMPGGMSGVELAQACRAQCPTLPILITSGYNQESVSFGDGCWDDIRFLPKPYTMAALARMARETIDATVLVRER